MGKNLVGAASPSYDFHLVFFHKTILGNERGVTLGQKTIARIVVENGSDGGGGFAFHTFGVGGKTYYLRGFTNSTLELCMLHNDHTNLHPVGGVTKLLDNVSENWLQPGLIQ